MSTPVADDGGEEGVGCEGAGDAGGDGPDADDLACLAGFGVAAGEGAVVDVDHDLGPCPGPAGGGATGVARLVVEEGEEGVVGVHVLAVASPVAPRLVERVPQVGSQRCVQLGGPVSGGLDVDV